MTNRDKQSVAMIGLFFLLTEEQKEMALNLFDDCDFGEDETFIIGRACDVSDKE